MDRFKKIYSKGLIGLSAAAVTLLPLNSAALANEAAAPAQAEVLAAVKFPPLQTLAQNLLGAARKIYPSQEVEILPMLFLGGFGYPTFPGVSQTDGVSLFALLQQGADEPVKFVAIAKLAADSPTRGALALPPYSFVFEERGEWTLIARSAEDIKAVSNVAELVAINSDKADFGVEARLYLKDGGKQFAKDFVTGMISTVEGPAKSLVAGLDDVVVALLERYDWLGYGISTNADFVSTGLVVKPRAGTADAAFVNKALKTGEVNGAQYLSSDAVVGMVGRYDIAESKTLLSSYKSVFARLGNEQLRTLVDEAIDSTVAFLDYSDGSNSSVLLGFDGVTPSTLSIGGGSATTAQIDAYYQQVFDKLVPQAMAIVTAVTGSEAQSNDFPMKWEVRTDIATVESGEKVGAFVIVSPNAEDSAKPQEDVTYYAGVKGYAITSSNLDELKALAAKVAKGEAVISNLAKAFPLDAHTFGKGNVRTVELVAEILKMVSGELSTEEAAASKQMIEALKTKGIKPISLEAKARDGRLVYSMSLDSASIGALVKFSNESGAFAGAGQQE